MNQGFASLVSVVLLALLLSVGALAACRSVYASRQQSWFFLEHTLVRQQAEECTSLAIYRYLKGYSYAEEIPVHVYTTEGEVCSVSVARTPSSLSIHASATSSVSFISLHTEVELAPLSQTFIRITRSYEDL